jgi:hypothetical protein
MEQRTRPTNWKLIWLVVLATVLALLPVVFRLPAPAHTHNPVFGILLRYGLPLLAAAGCYFFDRKLPQRERLNALLLCLALSLLTNYLHLWLVDSSGNTWGSHHSIQLQLHEAAIMSKPEALPHSYRFLPDGIIRLFEQVTGDFDSARDSYRSFFGLFLFYALYRFARLYLQQGGAILCLALWSAILPVSYRYYAGQPADPMSHLSFLLAFTFLETEQFAWLLLTILIGSLAKETILAMSGYYALFHWREPQFARKAILLLATSGLICLGVRAVVLGFAPNYSQISGVTANHIAENWNNYRQWIGPFIFTAGFFCPFCIVGWRDAPITLRRLVLFLFPVLFLSGLVFSWLREGRNFMPLCAPLIVITAGYLLPRERLIR